MITISLYLNQKPFKEYSVKLKGNFRDQIKLLVQDIKARYSKQVEENQYQIWLKVESRMNKKTTNQVPQ